MDRLPLLRRRDLHDLNLHGVAVGGDVRHLLVLASAVAEGLQLPGHVGVVLPG